MSRYLDGIEVIIDPNKDIASTGEILVGLGNTNRENQGLVLQHKTQNRHYQSLSQYVSETDIATLSSADQFHRLFIEDFSVDTVVSIWLFFAKMNSRKMPDIINLWIDYANRWERGDVTTTGKPFESYGCLQNALVLSVEKQSAKSILLKSLSLLEYLIVNNIDPSVIPSTIDNPQYLTAIPVLVKEYGKYETIVQKSEVSMLHIPEIADNNRLAVSGIFIETDMVTSIQKVFLRNDTKSPTGDGYALMAVYNATAKGSGNDIVISVDPIKNIYLEALWKKLEREEDILWNGGRPKDFPRPLKSYPENNGPNQPWWDDLGSYTLIAAPKMVGDEYGRRVGWKRVKQLIKQLYRGVNI